MPTLSLPPFLGRPTTGSILINARNGESDVLARLEVRRRGTAPWVTVGADRAVAAGDFMTWAPDGLAAGTGYEYRLLEGVLEGSDHPFKFVCIHHAVVVGMRETPLTRSTAGAAPGRRPWASRLSASGNCATASRNWGWTRTFS